jgi:hypothetical protein
MVRAVSSSDNRSFVGTRQSDCLILRSTHANRQSIVKPEACHVLRPALLAMVVSRKAFDKRQDFRMEYRPRRFGGESL